MADALTIALSGLQAQTARLNAAASNIANAGDTGTLPAAPGTAASASGASSSAPAVTVYKPLQVSLVAQESGGVAATITADQTGYSAAYDPSSPLANGQGLVATPNVDYANETVNLLESKEAYKANISVIKTADEMEKELLDTLA